MDNTIIPDKNLSTKKDRKSYKAIFLIIVALLLVGSAGYLYLNKNKSKVQLPCKNDDIAAEFNALGNFLDADSNKINELISSVKLKPNYSSSTNCMYIIVLGAIRDGDIELARNSYNSMINLKNDNDEPLPVFKNAIGINKLDALITDLEKNVIESRSSIILIGTEDQSR